MNPMTERVLTLLSEVDEACKKLGICYICGGLLPKAYVEVTCEDFDSMQIFVKAEHMWRLMKRLKRNSRKGRGLESFINNPDGYPTLSFHYADLSTTVFTGNKPAVWKHSCAFIDIVPLFADLDLPHDQRLMREAVLINNKRYAEKLFASTENEIADEVRMCNIRYRGKRELARESFLKKVWDEKMPIDAMKKILAFAEFDGKIRKVLLPARMFSQISVYRVAGTEAPMPSDINKWYEKCYPQKNGERKYPVYRNQYTVASTRVPYERMRACLQRDPVPEEEIREIRSRINKKQKQIADRKTAIDAVWEYAMDLYQAEVKAK